MVSNKRFYLLVWLLLAVFALSNISNVLPSALAATPTPENRVYIYFFWGDGCPHCAKAKQFFENLLPKYPEVVYRDFEVYYNSDNQKLFLLMMQKYGVEQSYVPTIFIGHFYLQGYSEAADPEIEKAINYCLENGCADPGEGVPGSPAETAPTAKTNPTFSETKTLDPTPTRVPGNDDPDNLPDAAESGHYLDLPLIGRVDLDLQSVAFSTALIAFVDGFNPCSMWVLSMLLALTLHTGSRKKVLFIGLVFLTVTAGIYALFIAGLFSALKFVGFLGWIQIVVALVALFFGLVNIKDYFWYKEGLSLTIAEDKKSGIFKRMRAVMDASNSFWGLLGATIVLAAGVSFVEFSCTAGFPVLWANLLNSQNIAGTSFLLLLLLYMVVYQIDISAIFFSALVSLKASRVEEKHGRLLKLAGGMLMLALSVVMIVDPSLMNNLGSSLMIFGFAFLAAAIVLLLHRVILPKLGIQIGSDLAQKPRRHK